MSKRTPKVATHNRGVNITSDQFESNEGDTTNRLQTELQNVFETFDTNSPHFMYRSSSIDEDNEDSLISSTSIISSVMQVKQMGISKDPSLTNCLNESSDTCHLVKDDNRECMPPLCVPAVLPPAVLCMNPQCVCMHSQRCVHQLPMYKETNGKCISKKNYKEKKCKISKIFERLAENTRTGGDYTDPLHLYKHNTIHNYNMPKVNVYDKYGGPSKFDHNRYTHDGPPKKILHPYEMPSKRCNCPNVPKNTPYAGMILTQHNDEECMKWSQCVHDKYKCKDTKNDSKRVDVYYFDHGNAAYYRTTDSIPVIQTELLGEKAETYATKFWAEFFGTFYIGCAFFTSFFLQLVRFVFHSIVRPLTIGVLQLLSDYFMKPCLAVCFNSIIQPPLIFIYNIATSLRDLCEPVAEACGYFLREMSSFCRSIRVFEIKGSKCKCAASSSSSKVNAEKNCEKIV